MVESAERKDAVRNRALLLEAARSVVSSRGPDVPLEEIARAAGVSRTTLHRHFPNRSSLAAAVLAENVEHIESRARELTGRADAAELLFHEVLSMQIESPWLARMIMAGRGEELDGLRRRTLLAFEAVMDLDDARHRRREGAGAEDALLAMPMMMAALAVQDDPQGVADVDRARRILHRGLFTTPPPETSPEGPTSG